LNGLEERGLDDGRMSAWMVLAFMGDFAEVDAVPEQVMQGADA
jgi:hypothetical protein